MTWFYTFLTLCYLSPQFVLACIFLVLLLDWELTITNLNYFPFTPPPMGLDISDIALQYPHKWVKTSWRHLGVNIPLNMDKLVAMNHTKAWKESKTLMFNWNKLALSWVDRISVVKMMILPTFLFFSEFFHWYFQKRNYVCDRSPSMTSYGLIRNSDWHSMPHDAPQLTGDWQCLICHYIMKLPIWLISLRDLSQALYRTGYILKNNTVLYTHWLSTFGTLPS